MPFPVRFGNWAVAKFLEVLHNGPTLTDVGCTNKLINREVLERVKPLFPLSRGDARWSPDDDVSLKGYLPIESFITSLEWRATHRQHVESCHVGTDDAAADRQVRLQATAVVTTWRSGHAGLRRS
jgi:hypothetical protein